MTRRARCHFSIFQCFYEPHSGAARISLSKCVNSFIPRRRVSGLVGGKRMGRGKKAENNFSGFRRNSLKTLSTRNTFFITKKLTRLRQINTQVGRVIKPKGKSLELWISKYSKRNRDPEFPELKFHKIFPLECCEFSAFMAEVELQIVTFPSSTNI